MSISFYTPNTASNLNWNNEHAQLSVTNIQANGGKYLRINDNTDVLEWATKNIPNSIVELNSVGKVPDALLPSFVNDVRIYANLTALQTAEPTGEQGVIYLTEDNGYSYRWTGTVYFNVSTQGFYTKTELDTAFNNKLSLSGGTMTGAINMNSNNITNGGIFNCNNVNSTSLSSNGYYNSLGEQFMAFSTEIEALKNLDMNTNNISNVGTLTATTSNLGTLGTNVNLGTKNLSNGGVITCTNITCPDISTTRLYDIGGGQYGSLATNTLTMIKPITMSTNDISGIGTLTATTSNLGTLGSDVNLGTKNLSNGGIVTCTNMNSPNIATTTLYDIGGTPYGSLASNLITLVKPISMSSNNISGIGTASGTTANFTNVTGITSLSSANATVTNNLTISNSLTGTGGSAYLQGQAILYYHIPYGATGVIVQNLATLPAFCSSVQYISSVVVCQSDNLGGNYTVIPQYGTFQGSTRQWWSWSYDVTTRAFTITFTDIGLHGHLFDAFGIISMKVIFNVS